MPSIEKLHETIGFYSPGTQKDLMGLASGAHLFADKVQEMTGEQSSIMLASFTSPTGAEWTISKGHELKVTRVQVIEGEEYIDVITFISGGMVIKGWSIVAAQINGEITQLRGPKLSIKQKNYLEIWEKI